MNDRCRLVGIPREALEYTVSGRSPLEWAIDSLRWKHDKGQGIRNNRRSERMASWTDEPFNLIRHLRRLVYVSVQTARIVKSLPLPLEPQQPDSSEESC